MATSSALPASGPATTLTTATPHPAKPTLKFVFIMTRFLPAILLLCIFSALFAQPQTKTKHVPRYHGARICFTSAVQDAGRIPEGPVHLFKFPFQNCGDEPIIITQVQSSCGCLTGDWPKEPIMPGKWDTIHGNYYTRGRIGRFEKTLRVYSNDTTHWSYGEHNFHLTLKGTVVPDR